MRHTPRPISTILFAGAIGDAVGGAHEGAAPGSAYDENAATRLAISDDTQLTLATCDAVAAHGHVDPESIAQSFVASFRDGRLSGLGSATLQALTGLDAGGHWALVGARGERAAGNGAAMRIAPLAFVLDVACDRDRRVFRDVCRITHHDDEAYLGALALCHVLRATWHGAPLDRSATLEIAISTLPDSRMRDRLTAVREDPTLTSHEYAGRFGAGGYVVDSVPFAILVAIESESVSKLLTTVVGVGGDVDTNAAMAMQLRAAAHGLDDHTLAIGQRIEHATEILRAFSEFERHVLNT